VLKGVIHLELAYPEAEHFFPQSEKIYCNRRVGKNQSGNSSHEQYNTAGRLDMKKALKRIDYAVNRITGQPGKFIAYFSIFRHAKFLHKCHLQLTRYSSLPTFSSKIGEVPHGETFEKMFNNAG